MTVETVMKNKSHYFYLYHVYTLLRANRII